MALFIHRGTTFIYFEYSISPYLSPFSNVWKASYTISASIFVDVPYWPPYGTDKFISCVIQSSSQWFFSHCEEIVITWTHIGWIRWMFQNLPLLEVRDSSSGVTACIVMKNDGVLYHQVSSFSPERWTTQFWLNAATSILIQERCSSFVNWS